MLYLSSFKPKLKQSKFSAQTKLGYVSTDIKLTFLPPLPTSPPPSLSSPGCPCTLSPAAQLQRKVVKNLLRQNVDLQRLDKSPQNFFVHPGIPAVRHRHLLQSSFQLSPGWRDTPLSSCPQPFSACGNALTPRIIITTRYRKLFIIS